MPAQDRVGGDLWGSRTRPRGLTSGFRLRLRTAQTRPPGRRLDDPADPEASPDPTGTGPCRHHLATVPAHSSRRHAGRRLLPRRLRGDAAADLRAVRSRGRRPLPACAGCDGASRRALDHSAGPQPRHGPRRTRRPVPVPGSRSSRTVHGLVRHCAGRCGHRSGQDPGPLSAGELFRRTVRADGADRADRPDADLQRAAPSQSACEYAAHYNTQRPHRALQLRPPRPEAPVPEPVHGRIRRRPILGGLINHYEPAA